MTAIDDFFAELERRGHEPMLRRVSATVRWDILDGDRIEHRLVRIDHRRPAPVVGIQSCDRGSDARTVHRASASVDRPMSRSGGRQ
jgi:hypothetical protein